MILTPRVVPAGDGADPTSVSIPGFLFDAKAKAKKAFARMQVEMQFLDTHENLYLELHRDSARLHSNQKRHCKTSIHCSLWK